MAVEKNYTTDAGLYFVPFAFGPLAVTLGLALACHSTSAQVLLAVSSVLYGAWFAYVCAQAFFVNPDPQSPIAFLFVGIYAIPVLVVFWIAAAGRAWAEMEADGELTKDRRKRFSTERRRSV